MIGMALLDLQIVYVTKSLRCTHTHTRHVVTNHTESRVRLNRGTVRLKHSVHATAIFAYTGELEGSPGWHLHNRWRHHHTRRPRRH